MSILLVEDDIRVRDLLCEALGERYGCVSAGSAEEALESLRVKPFDVMLADLNLPGMSGFELVRLAGERYPGMRVVIISGRDVDGRDGWGALGVVAYIHKPLDLAEVERCVGLALSRPGNEWG